jgi:hypothetical protein
VSFLALVASQLINRYPFFANEITDILFPETGRDK